MSDTYYATLGVLRPSIKQVQFSLKNEDSNDEEFDKMLGLIDSSGNYVNRTGVNDNSGTEDETDSRVVADDE